MSKLIRISDATVEQLEALAVLTGRSKQKLIDQAIISFAHEQKLKTANEQYSLLKSDTETCRELIAEESEWDNTLLDGLDNDDN